MTPDLSTINAIGAVLIAAIATFYFARRSDAAKNKQSLRTQAYIDFIKFTSGVALSRKFGTSEDVFVSLVGLSDSKVRIALFGSRAVATATAEFFRRHDGQLSSPESISSFLKIAQVMRYEARFVALSERDIATLIFGNDIVTNP